MLIFLPPDFKKFVNPPEKNLKQGLNMIQYVVDIAYIITLVTGCFGPSSVRPQPVCPTILPVHPIVAYHYNLKYVTITGKKTQPFQ